MDNTDAFSNDIHYPSWFTRIQKECEETYMGVCNIGDKFYDSVLNIIQLHTRFEKFNMLNFDYQVISLAVNIFNRYMILTEHEPLLSDQDGSIDLIHPIVSSHYIAVQVLHHGRITMAKHKFQLTNMKQIVADICVVLGGKLYVPTILGIVDSIISWYSLFALEKEARKIGNAISTVAEVHRVKPWKIAAAIVCYCISNEEVPDWLSNKSYYTNEFAIINFAFTTITKRLTKYNVDSFLNSVVKLSEEFDYKKLKLKMAKELSFDSPTVTQLKGTIAVYEKEVGEKVGKGGFGQVYMAMLNGEKVAVKKHKSDDVKNIEGKLNTEEGIREIAVMCSLSHSHVESIKTFVFDFTDFSLSTYMPYANTTLAKLIYNDSPTVKQNETYWKDVWRNQNITLLSPISYEQRIIYSIHLLKGLAFLHDNNIIHCDIKPSNLLIHGDTLKIADFGISYLGCSSVYNFVIGSTNIASTPYRDYNVLKSRLEGSLITSYNTGIDIWSAGITIMEMERACCPVGRPKDDKELLKRINKIFGEPEHPSYSWVSAIAGISMSKMLFGMVDFSMFRRYTAKQCLVLLGDS